MLWGGAETSSRRPRKTSEEDARTFQLQGSRANLQHGNREHSAPCAQQHSTYGSHSCYSLNATSPFGEQKRVDLCRLVDVRVLSIDCSGSRTSSPLETNTPSLEPIARGCVSRGSVRPCCPGWGPGCRCPSGSDAGAPVSPGRADSWCIPQAASLAPPSRCWVSGSQMPCGHFRLH